MRLGTLLFFLRDTFVKFGLRSVFALVFIAALLMVGWNKYLAPEDNYIEVGVFLKDWEVTKSTHDELSDLLQRPIPAEKRTRLITMATGIDGVLIKPGWSAIWFTTRCRDWDRTEAMRRLDKVVDAFLCEEPKLEIDHFKLQEYTFEIKDNTWLKRGLRKTTSDSYPL